MGWKSGERRVRALARGMMPFSLRGIGWLDLDVNLGNGWEARSLREDLLARIGWDD